MTTTAPHLPFRFSVLRKMLTISVHRRLSAVMVTLSPRRVSPLEKGGHALGEARLKAQQIVGLERIHAVGDVALVIAQQVDHAGAAEDVALIDALAVFVGGGHHHAPAVDDIAGDDAALGAAVARVARAGDPAAAVGGYGIHPIYPGQRQKPDHHKGQHAKAQFLLFHRHLDSFTSPSGQYLHQHPGASRAVNQVERVPSAPPAPMPLQAPGRSEAPSPPDAGR